MRDLPRCEHRRSLRQAGALAALLLTVSIFHGCLLVRTTEHHVRLNADGSGEAILRLYDIRSDAQSDSGIASDVARLLVVANGKGVSLFEQNTRKLRGRQFMISGDTLSMEIDYTFSSYTAVEGLRVNADNLFLVVGPTMDILKTNGKVEDWMEDLRRIVWPRDATRLSYIIREHAPRKATSIVRWYREQTR